MRKQQQIWEEEHRKSASIPKLASTKPSRDVVEFVEYLQNKGIQISGNVVDIGCGKGRNTIYLAEQSCVVYGMDYIQEALSVTQQSAEKAGVSHRVKLLQTEIDKTWPFADNFFDFAIDCFTSIDIETRAGRDTYKTEMLRTLKPSGYAFVAAVSINDELEKELMKDSPGPELNSVYWPTGKFQKNYNEVELKKFYKEFKLVTLKEKREPVTKLGRSYTGAYFWMILQKAR